MAERSAGSTRKPLTAADLSGKVVLVDFWTYSCINWLRTEPYVRAWAEKYKDQGLVVIGVHTPEFGFEKNLDNIRWAAKNYQVDYPIAIDSDYAVWRAFDNHYWPALYFIDAEGRIRHHQFGEGDYEQSEAIIQDLLAEAGMSGFDRELVSVDGERCRSCRRLGQPPVPGELCRLRRAARISPRRAGSSRIEPSVYAIPERLRLNQWALCGKLERSAARRRRSNDANGRLAFRFHARDLNLVMGPAAPGDRPCASGSASTARLRAANSGLDVDKDGNGSVTEQRLYQLIRQTAADRRPNLRDRVPRSGRRGVRLHVRLIRASPVAFDPELDRQHARPPVREWDLALGITQVMETPWQEEAPALPQGDHKGGGLALLMPI